MANSFVNLWLIQGDITTSSRLSPTLQNNKNQGVPVQLSFGVEVSI
jgi:hypothetical protein